MKHWMLHPLLCCSLFVATIAGLAQPVGLFSEESQSPSYDCRVMLTRNSTLTDAAAVRLLLEWQDARNHLSVTLTKTTISLATVTDGVVETLVNFPITIAPGTTTMNIGRRDGTMLISSDETLLTQLVVPRRDGQLAGITADKGWMASAELERVESPVFADDFMRSSDDTGAWKTVSGIWALQSAWDTIPHGNTKRFANAIYGQNPFAYVGQPPQNGAALCMAGLPNWERYTLTVAVKPAADSVVGVQVNMPDAQHGIRICWSAGNDRSPDGDRLAVYRVNDGQLSLLAEDQGGFIPEQWYALAVRSTLNGLAVSIDGRERIILAAVTPWRGGVALYAAGKNPAVFDDVTVYGEDLHGEFLLESRRARMSKRFIDDMNGMRIWSTNRRDWLAFPNAPGYTIYRWDITGDQWLSANLKPARLASGELTLVLNSDGTQPNSGYRAVMQLIAANKVRCMLYRAETALAGPCEVMLPAQKDIPVHLWHVGDHIRFEIDDEEILQATDPHPLPGMRPAYAGSGAFASPREVMVTGPGIYDYSFAEAPVDWYTTGNWMPSIRWSCAPNWSFLAGWSRGDAVLWHKKRFSGNHSLNVFLGLKMEYPRMREREDNRVRDFAVTICGDGANPRSGYTAIYNARSAAAAGEFNIMLLRNGVEVASTPSGWQGDDAHRHWWELEIRKEGDTVEFWMEGEKQPRLRYVDPHPIDGGVPAIWTTDNGITLARARIHATRLPESRQDAIVTIAEPYCPEWSSVGVAIPFDFRNSWSSKGKALQLVVTAQEEPDGAENSVRITGLSALFTPQTHGEYAYRVQVRDEDGFLSNPYHISLRVYDAAVGRDDSHALVLYRFIEESGNTVHDSSPISPPAPLIIPPGANAQWLAGQGLQLHGSTPIMTTRGVNKLAAITRTKAFTIELWVSTHTVAPPTNTVGSMLCWESGRMKQNFTVGQCWYDIAFGANGSGISPEYEMGSAFTASDAARAWLQHIVLAWDGKRMRCYIDGMLKAEGAVSSLNLAKFFPDAPLILGNHSYGGASYLGSYYLVAIHDRNLNSTDIMRHYQAGPAGKAHRTDITEQ